MSNDDLGDRMKFLEGFETSRRFLPGLPLYARIDGRGFSKFTKNMNRPFDDRMVRCIVETTKVLVDRTHATIGYCQSDEISLVWIDDNHNWFDGKVMKMASVLAGLASSAFCTTVIRNFDDGLSMLDKTPHFDARVISLPSKVEAANMLLWRNLDATKNAISMAASHYYSHKSLMNKSGSEKQEMLFQKGINFNSYPSNFKRGTFIRKETIEVVLTDTELEAIPPVHRPIGPVIRSVLKEVDFPPLNKISNRVEVLFNGAQPIMFA